MIGVEDVRVLVRDELEVPVVDVAERRHVLGRGHEEANRVVRQCAGRAVRALARVSEDDLPVGSPGVQPTAAHAVVDPLGDVGDVLRDRLEARVVGDPEVLRLDDAPARATDRSRLARFRLDGEHHRQGSPIRRRTRENGDVTHR